MNQININPFTENLSVNIGFQKDHNKTELIFDGLNTEDDKLFYLDLELSDNEYQPIPLVNNKWIVTSTYTDKARVFNAQIVEKINEQMVGHSPIFQLRIRPSVGGVETVKETVPPAFQKGYEKIVSTVTKIKEAYDNGDFKGDKGDKGDKGEPGRDGDNGKSAYQLALDNGFEGSEQEWLESLRYDHSDEFQAFVEQINDNVSLSKEYAESSKNEADRAEQAMSDKLDKNQGVENKGKVLSVDEQGNVIPTVFKNGSDNVLTNTVEKQENLHIEDSYETEMRDLKFYGKSTQVTTTGANLFSLGEFQVITAGSGTGYAVAPNNVLDLFKTLPNGDYYISYRLKGNGELGSMVGKIQFQDIKNSELLSIPTNAFNLNDDIKSRMAKVIVYGYISTTSTVYDFMLSKGTMPTPFEPYTDGKPSPSPDYPQKITSIEEVDVTICGKNLIDEEKMKNIENWVNGAVGYKNFIIKVKPKTKYIFHRKNNLGIGLNLYLALNNAPRHILQNVQTHWIIHSSTGSINVDKFVFTSNEYGEVYFRSRIKTQTDLNNLFNILEYVQIEEGTVVTSYEPYKSQNIHFTPPQPLYSTLDGKIADEVDVVSGVYRYNMEKVFLNGSEEFLQDYESNLGYYGRYFLLENGNGTLENQIFCNYLPYVQYSWAQQKIGCCQNAKKQIHLKFANETLGITDDTPLEEKRIAFANYLKKLDESGNPLYVIIGVKQKEIPIDPIQLATLRTLYTYTGVTNFLCNAPVSFTYEISQQINRQNVENRLKALEAKLLLQGGN